MSVNAAKKTICRSFAISCPGVLGYIALQRPNPGGLSDIFELWFNRACHDRVIRKSGNVHAHANYYEGIHVLQSGMLHHNFVAIEP